MNNTQRPIDCKREEYRKYLERTGVLEALTKTLGSLFEESEKPTDALSYIFKLFNESFPDKNIKESKDIENELIEAKAKIEKLSKDLADAQAELAALKRAEEKEEEAMLEDTPESPLKTISIANEQESLVAGVDAVPAAATAIPDPQIESVVSDTAAPPDVSGTA